MRWMVIAVAVAALGAGCEAKAAKSTRAGCDLSGHYRLQYDAGVGQWLWFRFKVDKSGQTAVMTLPSAFRLEAAKNLRLDPDPAACKLTITMPGTNGDVLAQATLDPTTNKVTGTLRISGERQGVTLEGIRDVGEPLWTDPCVKPGVYELIVPAEQDWTSDNKDVTCEELRIAFLVEPFGERLAVDMLDRDGTAAWGAEDVFEDGACAVDVRFRHHEQSAYTKLTFAGDQVTATATHARRRMVSKGGDVGQCEIVSPMAWVERRPR